MLTVSLALVISWGKVPTLLLEAGLLLVIKRGSDVFATLNNSNEYDRLQWAHEHYKQSMLPFSHNCSQLFMHLCIHHSPSIFKPPPTSTSITIHWLPSALYHFTLQYVQDEAAPVLAALYGDVAAVRRLIEECHVNVNSRNKVCNRLKKCIYCTHWQTN